MGVEYINESSSSSSLKKVIGNLVMGASTSSITGRKSSIGTDAIQITDSEIRATNGVQIYADVDNPGIIYVGFSSDITANSDDITDGFPLAAGDNMFFSVRNPKDIWVVASNSNNTLWFVIV